jgi:hypothetical protein
MILLCMRRTTYSNQNFNLNMQWDAVATYSMVRVVALIEKKHKERSALQLPGRNVMQELGPLSIPEIDSFIQRYPQHHYNNSVYPVL